MVNYLCADKGVQLMALDGQITTEIIRYFTDRVVPIPTVHDSSIVESSPDWELMDVMQSMTREVAGSRKFIMKQEQLSLEHDSDVIIKTNKSMQWIVISRSLLQ